VSARSYYSLTTLVGLAIGTALGGHFDWAPLTGAIVVFALSGRRA
jgi:predicted MFS family arabinose efflux permease